MVRPLPFWKRCTRPTSNVGTTPAMPPWMRQDFAVVPPMSKQNISGRSNRRLKYWPAMTAAVGPDSMMRTGDSGAGLVRGRRARGGEFGGGVLERIEQALGGGLDAQARQGAHSLARAGFVERREHAPV